MRPATYKAEDTSIILFLDFARKFFILSIYTYILNYTIMFSLQIVQNPSFYYSQETLDLISEVISKNILKQQKWILNIVFVEGESIQNLNKNYRNKDSITDVLSFHYHDDFSDLSDEDLAWELVFCEEKILSQWEEYWLWTEKEFYKLVIHSVLHVLWYDHETDEEYEEMKKWEELVWNTIFN